ncbi:hypothetical protein TNCV_4048421 [Trichonephila clavipes]|nr:hypothetical protein TNCV_4048421 [Trichonephila clavipes]
MIMKFEETRDLDVLPGRGRMPVGAETAEKGATTIVERASTCIYSLASDRSMSRALEIPSSRVRKILRYI